MGSVSACAVTEKSVDVPYERWNSEKPDWRTPAVRLPTELALRASQQSANWLAAISSSTMKLVEQLRRRPRRLASRVPLAQRAHRLVV